VVLPNWSGLGVNPPTDLGFQSASHLLINILSSSAIALWKSGYSLLISAYSHNIIPPGISNHLTENLIKYILIKYTWRTLNMANVVGVATVHGGGRIQIPKDVREYLDVRDGDKIVFIQEIDGRIYIQVGRMIKSRYRVTE